jgi:hypothetical protein
MKILPASRGAKIRMLVLLSVLLVLGFIYRDQTYFVYSRAPVLYYYLRYTPREGDVLFQSLPHNDLVDAIEGTTRSPYSHCGVVLQNDKNQWMVIEAIGNVHETPLFLWEFRGRGGRFDVYRLDSKYDAVLPRLKQELLAYRGYPYDGNYDMTNSHAAYCSSLIFLSFQKASGEEMGKLEELGDLNWKPFETFIKDEQGGNLPLDRVMITPASLARAPQLHEVYRSGIW